MKALIFDLDGVVVNTAKYSLSVPGKSWRKNWELISKRFRNERLKRVSRMRSSGNCP